MEEFPQSAVDDSQEPGQAEPVVEQPLLVEQEELRPVQDDLVYRGGRVVLGSVAQRGKKQRRFEGTIGDAYGPGA